jgi:hypothetical protein
MPAGDETLGDGDIHIWGWHLGRHMGKKFNFYSNIYLMYAFGTFEFETSPNVLSPNLLLFVFSCLLHLHVICLSWAGWPAIDSPNHHCWFIPFHSLLINLSPYSHYQWAEGLGPHPNKISTKILENFETVSAQFSLTKEKIKNWKKIALKMLLDQIIINLI